VRDKTSWSDIERTLFNMRHHKNFLQFPDPGADVILPIQTEKNPVRRFRFPGNTLLLVFIQIERSLDPRLMFAQDFFATQENLSTKDKVFMTVIYELVGKYEEFFLCLQFQSQYLRNIWENSIAI